MNGCMVDGINMHTAVTCTRPNDSARNMPLFALDDEIFKCPPQLLDTVDKLYL